MSNTEYIQKLVLVEGIQHINEHLALGYVHFGYPFALNNAINLVMSSPSVESAKFDNIPNFLPVTPIEVKKAKKNAA